MELVVLSVVVVIFCSLFVSSKSLLEFVVDTLDDSVDNVPMVEGVTSLKSDPLGPLEVTAASFVVVDGFNVVTSISNLGILVVIKSRSILVEPVINEG